MTIGLREVRSVTEFQRNIKEYVGRLERAETLAAIRRGIDQFEKGDGIPLVEAEAVLRRKHGFSR